MKNQQLYIKCKKKLGNFTLDVDLDICPSFTAISGVSGAGKTTLLNMISGLTSMDSGTIKWNDKTLSDSNRNIHVPPHKREIGYIFQDSRLFPNKTVTANLKYGLNLTPRDKMKFAFEAVVDVLGLSSFLDRKPDTLSGGEKQRVALGMALLASPGLLLMDEPLTALDTGTKLRLLSYLKEIHTIFNLPILYVSHDLTTVINFANDAIVMNEGKVKVLNEAHKILVENSGKHVIGDIENIFKAKVKSRFQERGISELDAGGFSLFVTDNNWNTGDQLMIEIPASEIILATEEPKCISARNILKGTIIAIHSLNKRCLVDIDIGNRITAEILQITETDLELKTGMEIYVIIKAKCVHLINA